MATARAGRPEGERAWDCLRWWGVTDLDVGGRAGVSRGAVGGGAALLVAWLCPAPGLPLHTRPPMSRHAGLHDQLAAGAAPLS